MEGEAEVGVAAAEGQLFPTGPPNLSRLAIDSDWYPQQEKVVVVGCVGSEVSPVCNNNLSTRLRLLTGHG